ncbi:peptidase M16 [Thiomicrospira aerophila AL3]|uniref:Peptidase M16 n=1 Tax=Thiomicrospira aerophila AL3 TaxID=717772 RepID=W0DUF0_9GAMM|nr:pitrilysin family protein [Thiomicrospira aerophila]AHF00624.1 peptidase M16 [Thiomicrospira aerophila AL3]
MPSLKGWGLSILLALSGHAFATESSTLFETQLDNGLQVIVKSDHRSPIVVHQVWYRVGANYEPTHLTGISHMLEHMMFKGTENMAPGEFSREVSRLGGRDNAFTSANYTAYFQIVGREHLGRVMEMEADRMANLKLTEEEFQPERNVVIQERLWAIDDRPSARLFEQFKATAFMSSPERNPIIGWMDDIKNYTLEDLQAWYDRWYSPSNATLVVVGDITPDEVLTYAKQTYGQILARDIAPPRSAVEIPQQGQRRIILKDAVPVPSLLIGFHAPSLVTAEDPADVYALAVLSSILGGNDSSLLTQALVRDQQLASSAGSFYRFLGRLGSQFALSAQPNPGVSVAQLEEALLAQITRLQNEPVTQAELNRVLAQAEAAHVFSQDSIQSQANMLGMLVSVGLPASTFDDYVDNLRQVTPEQIQQVANRYLQLDQSTVAILEPSGETNRRPAARPDFGGRSH